MSIWNVFSLTAFHKQLRYEHWVLRDWGLWKCSWALPLEPAFTSTSVSTSNYRPEKLRSVQAPWFCPSCQPSCKSESQIHRGHKIRQASSCCTFTFYNEFSTSNYGPQKLRSISTSYFCPSCQPTRSLKCIEAIKSGKLRAVALSLCTMSSRHQITDHKSFKRFDTVLFPCPSCQCQPSCQSQMHRGQKIWQSSSWCTFIGGPTEYTLRYVRIYTTFAPLLTFFIVWNL